MSCEMIGSEIPDESLLATLDWEDGKRFSLPAPGYRHRVVVVCDARAAKVGMFRNGEFPYYAYIVIVSRRGHEIKQACIVVPVLPDGRVLMCVNHRPAIAHFGEANSRSFRSSGMIQKLDCMDSLEFPGGGIEPGEDPAAGCLREGAEEGGFPSQDATLYFFAHAMFPICSDVACRNYIAFLRLTKPDFKAQVDTDGGLRIFALEPNEVELAFACGAIVSAQSLGAWFFYKSFANPAERYLKDVMEKFGGMGIRAVMTPAV